MADHMIKLKEVPKGQKLQYLWDYYRVPAIVTVISAIVVISLIKVIFFTSEPDINILLTTKNTVSDENINILNEKLDLVIEDYNDDDKKNHQTMPIVFNNEAAEQDPQYASAIYNKFVAELSTGLSIIQITDEEFFNRYETLECLATYAIFDEFGVKAPEGDKDAIVKIPLSEIKLFSDIKHNEELYLTIRPPMNSHIEKKKDRQLYIDNLEFINKIISE